MDSELTLRSLKRFAAKPNAIAVAETAERQLRETGTIDLERFARDYYSITFVTGDPIELPVLEWLFPPTTSTEASPLGGLTRDAVFDRGLLRHVSAVGCLPALEFLLNVDWFSQDTTTMTGERRQRLLDEALRCARKPDVVNFLLAHGADPESLEQDVLPSPWRMSVMYRAGVGQWVAMSRVAGGVRVLVDNGIALVGNRALASDQKSSVSVCDVRDLLQAGVDPVDVVAEAVRRERVDIVEMAIKTSAFDVDLCSQGSGLTPLEHAIQIGQWGIAEALLQLGPDVNADSDLCSSEGQNQLHLACHADPSLMITHIQLLLAEGADPNCRNAQGHTPLEVLLFRMKRLLPFVPTRMQATAPATYSPVPRMEVFYSAAEILIVHGADVHLRSNESGSSYFEVLSEDEFGKSLIQKLVSAGVISEHASPPREDAGV